MPTGPGAPISPCDKQRADSERYWHNSRSEAAGERGVKPLFTDNKLICCLHLPLSDPMKETRCGVQRGACSVAWLTHCYLPCLLPPSAAGQKSLFVFSLSLFFEREQIDVTGSAALAEWALMKEKDCGEGVHVLYVWDIVRVTVQQGGQASAMLSYCQLSSRGLKWVSKDKVSSHKCIFEISCLHKT